ncbi:MAG: hypothetical protein OEM02_04440 [Desulfobulbaceae bacterium]|nr:hypothetical protein [Desulfobulbaceae bacterium]
MKKSANQALHQTKNRDAVSVKRRGKSHVEATSLMNSKKRVKRRFAPSLLLLTTLVYYHLC